MNKVFIIFAFLFSGFLAEAAQTETIYCFKENIKVDSIGTCAARYARVDAAKQGELGVKVTGIKQTHLFGEGIDIWATYDIRVESSAGIYTNTVKLCGVYIDTDEQGNHIEEYTTYERCPKDFPF